MSALALWQLCQFLPQAELDDVPLYVNAKEVVTADGKAEALELNYIMCFAHNGPYTVGGCFQARCSSQSCYCAGVCN